MTAAPDKPEFAPPIANIVLPDGQMIGQAIRPQIAARYATGTAPLLLPDHSGDA